MPPAKKQPIPDGVKQPTDHESKSDTRAPEFLVANVRGANWHVPIEALDDFELVDDLNRIDDGGDATRMPAVLRRLLPDVDDVSQWRAAMDAIRDKDTGRVSVKDGAAFVGELLEALNPNS